LNLSITCANLSTGGKKILLKNTGKDATKQFQSFHNDAVLESVAKPFLIGVVGGEQKSKL
jgi:cytochrome b involved in lipid metabolism